MTYRKYGNRRTEVDGVTFDSKAEAARWQQLQLLQRAGEIRNLQRQVSYPIVVNGVKVCIYRADFVYEDECGQVVEDVKGMKTPTYNLKKKLMKAVHGIDILES